VQDSEYLIRCKRTLDNIIKDHSKKKYSCKHLPLIQIEPDYVIPDELHLLLRITDVLLRNLIATAITHDKRTLRTRWKLKTGPMLYQLISNIRRCGIPFKIWKNEDTQKSEDYCFTSLTGNNKKKLLKYFPSKIPLC